MMFTKKIAVAFLFLLMSISTGVMAQTTNEVSDDELTKFIAASQQIQMENQKAQGEMMVILEKEGMPAQRFGEIQAASTNPDSAIEVTAKEQEVYGKVVAEMEKMQPQIQQKMEDHVATSGLTVDRFKEIAEQLQSNPELQQRAKLMMKQ